MRQVLLPSHESYILPTIQMLVRALEKRGVPCVRSPLHWRPARAIAKLLGAANIRRLPLMRSRAPVFFHLNHVWPNAFYPYVLAHPLVTYTFDCWPYLYDGWQEVFELNRPRIAFISARKSVAEMQRRLPGMDFRWLPEALYPAGFDGSAPLAAREIDVLELGRCYPAYHDRIRSSLAERGCCHHFSSSGKPLFLPYNEAVKAYANSKVVVCFPKSVTSPEQAEGVETTTFRYFECMFSKALMIGHCPQELIEILGYNPMIEANMDLAAHQLVNDILPKITDFQELVERNYDTICRTWTVDHQAARIRDALDEVVDGRVITPAKM